MYVSEKVLLLCTIALFILVFSFYSACSLADINAEMRFVDFSWSFKLCIV